MTLHVCDGCGLKFRNLKTHQKSCSDARELFSGNLLKRRIEDSDYAQHIRAEKRRRKQEMQREASEAQERAVREAAARAEAERARLEVSGTDCCLISCYMLSVFPHIF